MELQQLQYPIGLFEPQPFSTEQLNEWLLDIKYLPDSIEIAVQNLDTAQLQTPYRP
ncbi:MAG TPA: metal-dependent hydrolase, partial [Chitinophagaceae bacterium]|nr:metal-dependent hydrolase [Chitinophagaceae bacterium]